MANESELQALLAQVPLGDLAAKFGVDEATVNAAVSQALPGLLGGLAANASDEAGAAKLHAAVQKHEPAPGKLKLSAIDTEDGQKIVKHVLGDKKDDVAQALAAKSGDSAIADLIPKLLPVLAPLVMQFLAGKLGGGAASSSGSSASGGLGDILGGLLGGAGGGSGAGANSGGLGGLLGGLFGK